MDLKKLYADICIRLKREIPIYEFLSYTDTGIRAFLCRFSKKLLLGRGEYTSPENLNSSVALDEVFYTALLYFILGSINADEKMLKKSESEAESAYKTLWKRVAVGKRRACDRW